MFSEIFNTRTIDEILGMIAPIVELFAFACLDIAQRLDKKTAVTPEEMLQIPMVLRNLFRVHNEKEFKRINFFYRTGYFAIYLGCLLWLLSSLIPLLQELHYIK